MLLEHEERSLAIATKKGKKEPIAKSLLAAEKPCVMAARITTELIAVEMGVLESPPHLAAPWLRRKNETPKSFPLNFLAGEFALFVLSFLSEAVVIIPITDAIAHAAMTP